MYYVTKKASRGVKRKAATIEANRKKSRPPRP